MGLVAYEIYYNSPLNIIHTNKVSDCNKVVFFLSIFEVFGNKYCRQKVSDSINFKLFTIFPTTYVRINTQIESKVSTIFYVPVVPEN